MGFRMLILFIIVWYIRCDVAWVMGDRHAYTGRRHGENFLFSCASVHYLWKAFYLPIETQPFLSVHDPFILCPLTFCTNASANCVQRFMLITAKRDHWPHVPGFVRQLRPSFTMAVHVHRAIKQVLDSADDKKVRLQLNPLVAD